MPSCRVTLVSIVDEDGDEEGDGDAAVVSIVGAVTAAVGVATGVVAPVVQLATQRLRNCRKVAVVESGSDCSGEGNVMCGVGCGDGTDAIVDGGVSTVGGGCKFVSSSYVDWPLP